MVSTHLPNGIQSQRSYDQRNRLVYLHYQKASNPLLTYKYGHNQLGQRIVEEKIFPDQNKLSRFHYNPRRELVKSDRLVNGIIEETASASLKRTTYVLVDFGLVTNDRAGNTRDSYWRIFRNGVSNPAENFRGVITTGGRLP